MEEIDVFIAIGAVIFGVLQLILLFKIWNMTNDVRNIKEHLCNKSPTDSQSVNLSSSNHKTSIVSMNTEKLHSYTIKGDYMRSPKVHSFVESIRKFYIKCLQNHCKYEDIIKGVLQIIEIEGNDVSKSGFDPKKVAVDVVKQLEKIVGK